MKGLYKVSAKHVLQNCSLSACHVLQVMLLRSVLVRFGPYSSSGFFFASAAADTRARAAPILAGAFGYDMF